MEALAELHEVDVKHAKAQLEGWEEESMTAIVGDFKDDFTVADLITMAMKELKEAFVSHDHL